MSKLDPCPKCGAVLSETTLDGMCPGCAAGAVLAFAMASPSGAPLPTLDADSSQPRTTDFGEFELIEEIARGGMGVVYKARQKRLNRMVAVKMILAGRFAGEEQVKRFRAEAEAAASLRHPNIIAIHDVGEEAGQHYFSMDLIEGSNLNNLVRENPLTHKNAAQFVQIVAEAVQYAHERGVIHRDLKPSNIIVDQMGRPHVTDFGLAKRMGEDSDITQSGQVLGSPNFSAPEQAGGRTHEIGPRSDVYALGAILYYLLVGRPPFLAETIDLTLSMVLTNDPVSPRKLDPGVPRDLETICLKCLEKNQERRYQSAGAMAEEIDRFLEKKPIHARPSSAAEKLWRWSCRHPTESILTLAVCIALLAGVGGVLWQWQRAERLAQEESQQRTRAERTLIQLEMQRAEDLLEGDRSAQAAAFLAHTLRREPSNHVAAMRLVAILSDRSFALPETPPLSHGARVADADFSPDGKLVVTASGDKTARIWDSATGRMVSELDGHDDELLSARFSPDGKFIATGSKDGTARLWTESHAEQLHPALLHKGEVSFIEFSHDGELLLTVSNDRQVHIWNVRSGREVSSPLSHKHQLSAAHFSPNGDHILTATLYEGLLRIWDVKTGKIVGAPFGGPATCWSARFSPDGRRVVASYLANTAKIWDVESRQMVGESFRHAGQVTDAMFSPAVDVLVTTCADGAARIWSLKTGKPMFEPLRHRTWVRTAQLSDDGRELLTIAKDNTVRVWDVATGEPLIEQIQLDDRLATARLAPDGRHVVTASENSLSQVWDVRPGQSRPIEITGSDPLWSVQFSPDGRRLLSVDTAGYAEIWDARTGQMICPPLRHRRWILSACFSPDGTRVLTGSDDSTACLWDAKTGEILLRLKAHSSRVEEVSFSPDGGLLLTCSIDGTARIWDARTGLAAAPTLVHKGRLWDAQFSPDGTLVGTGGNDHHARVWDTKSGELRAQFAHDGAVRKLTFSPNGELLLSASEDNTARVGNIETGQQTLVLKHSAPLTHAIFSADGRWIATASRDNTARLWDATSGLPMSEPMEHQSEVRGIAFCPGRDLVATLAFNHTARLWEVPSGKFLTDAFPHHSGMKGILFSPDGRWLGMGSTDARTMVWEVPDVSGPVPMWMIELAEAVVGYQLDEEGTLRRTDQHPAFLARRELEQRSEDDPYHRWARWFLADRETRMLSPSASVGQSHLDQLRLRKQQLALIPERHPDTPGQCLDLSAYYNAGLYEDWHGRRWPGNNLASFPAGRATLAGTEFDARGILQLSGAALEKVTHPYPKRIDGIPVGREVHRLHFLHAAGWGNFVPAGTIIGRYVLHYHDGESKSLPVHVGEDVLEWQADPGRIEAPAEAVLAWSGINTRQINVRLFKRTWENPRPGKEIASLDFESTMTDACLFIVAVTLEP